MKIQGIGLPFSPHQSSCSNKVPTNFEWTQDDSNIQVVMDMKIPEGISIPIPEGKKRYAWFCESREVVPTLQEVFHNEKLFNAIVDSYDGIFTCDKELVSKHDNIHFCFAGSNLPWISKQTHKIYKKSKLCSFIASNKNITTGHKQRYRVHDKLKVRVEGEPIAELFGTITGKHFGAHYGCHTPKYPPFLGWHDKSDGLQNYMFSIVIENARYDDYFTEKITDCFATGTIPVYWGTRNIGEYFDTDGIVVIPDDGYGRVDVELLDFMLSNVLTPDLYYGKMNAVKDNFERVKNMQLADDMLFEKIQELNN